MKKELGDFQTPQTLATKVCNLLKNKNVNPKILIEPTFGEGNFIQAALDSFDSISEVAGVEIQQKYIESTHAHFQHNYPDVVFHLKQGSVFELDFKEFVFSELQDIVFIGNPPWITISELTKLNSKNTPEKSNAKGLNGLEVKLGKSNFDVTEFIINKVIEFYNNNNIEGTIAFLCKNQTIKNIVHDTSKNKTNITMMEMFRFDAKKEFGVSVDASLFLLKINENKEKTKLCKVYELENPNLEIKEFGWVDGKFVSDTNKYSNNKNIDGECCYRWRSGIKHDIAKVFELKYADNKLVNGYEQEVDIENEVIYDLLKSSDLNKGNIDAPRKKIVVTQKKQGEDTNYIENEHPLAWSYLNSYKNEINKRASSVYRGKPTFSIFGVGDYTFAPYKIAISSMYKNPKFVLINPISSKPVLLDDTCNFLSFSNEIDAAFTYLLLNTNIVEEFLDSVCFEDAKRKYTIDTLKRID